MPANRRLVASDPLATMSNEPGDIGFVTVVHSRPGIQPLDVKRRGTSESSPDSRTRTHRLPPPFSQVRSTRQAGASTGNWPHVMPQNRTMLLKPQSRYQPLGSATVGHELSPNTRRYGLVRIRQPECAICYHQATTIPPQFAQFSRPSPVHEVTARDHTASTAEAASGERTRPPMAFNSVRPLPGGHLLSEVRPSPVAPPRAQRSRRARRAPAPRPC
jgi:hypothetical protein